MRTGSWLLKTVVVLALFTSSSLSYAQFGTFPLLNGGRNGTRFSQGAISQQGYYPNSSQNTAQQVSVVEAGRPNTAQHENAVVNSGNQNYGVSVQNAPATRRPGRNASSQHISNFKYQNNNMKLVRSGGRYDFIRLLTPEQVEKLEASEDCFYVVVPRRNFINAIPVSQEDSAGGREEAPVTSQDKRLASGSISQDEKAKRGRTVPGPFNKTVALQDTDEYVVFTLTGLEKDEQNLLRDAKNGRWDFADLLGAALIAEGLTTRESRAHYRSRFETLLAALKPRVAGLDDRLMKTQIVYDFLHKYALVGKYNLNCSSIASSLDSGVFNCVSATVLFNCFASNIGLDVVALETTGHAKSRVKYEDCYLDIETTCASWDRLPESICPYARSKNNLNDEETGKNVVATTEGPTAQLADNIDADSSVSVEQPRVSTGKVSFKPVVFDEDRPKMTTASSTRIVKMDDTDDSVSQSDVSVAGSTTFELDDEAPLGYSFTKNRRPMFEISDVELVATIYYNVGIDHYQSEDYEGAISSYIKAVQLAPNNQTMLGNLKATLNNWAIDIAMKEKKYEDAIRITELGLMLDPDFNEFNMNLPVFFHDWIEYLGKDNKWDEVRRVQEEYWKRFPKEN